MGRYLLRRGLEAIPVLFGISLITFIVIHLAPGDPTSLLLDLNSATPADVAHVRAQYGLDDPIPQQWWQLVQGLLGGDLRSIRTHQPTIDMALEALPTTLVLGFWSLIVGMVVGLLLGTVAAVHVHRALDDLLSVVALMGI